MWIKKPRALATSFLLTCIHMLCFFGTLYLLLTSLGEDISMVTIAGLFSLVYFVTLLPVSINGYGLQEISITVAFSSLAGVSQENSLATALLFRTLVMIASFPGAIYVGKMLTGVEKYGSNQEEKFAVPSHEVRDGTEQ